MSSVKYRVLLSCIQKKNMTRAAQELGYTQSAVSRIVAELESEWGIPLLIRNKKGVTATRQAQQLLPYIQQIVNTEKKIDNEIEAMNGSHPGHLSIGVFASISVCFLPQILEIFQKQYPEAKIRLRTGEYEEIEQWISDGDVDCGFLPAPVNKSMRAYPVISDQLVAVLPKDHPFADQEVYPVEQLANEVIISLKEYEDDEMNRFWSGLSIQPQISYEANDDYTILIMIEHGLGMGILHDLVVDTNRFNVVRKKLDIPHVRELDLASPGGGPMSPSVQAFQDAIRIWQRQTGFTVRRDTSAAPHRTK